MRHIHKATLTILAVFLSALLIACGHTTIEIGLTETTVPGHWQASYETFSGVKTVSTQGTAGQTLTLTYNAVMNKGTLEITVEDALRYTIYDVYLHESTKATVELPLYTTGTYHIVAHGSEASGSFDISWQVH